MKFFKEEKGETTISNMFFALLFAMGLIMLVNIGLFVFTSVQLYQTKVRADRAMSIEGGYTPKITTLIENNLDGYVDLSRVSVSATNYPINRGEPYSILIQYDFPFGVLNWSGSSASWAVITVPIRTHAFGLSEKVIR